MKRCVAVVMSIVLAVGLLPLPAFGVSVVPGSLDSGEELWLEANPEFVLQEGGLNALAEPSMSLRTLSVADKAGFEAAVVAKAEKWDGVSEFVRVDGLKSYGVVKDDLQDLFHHLMNENGQLFYLTGRCQFGIVNGFVDSFTLAMDTESFNASHVNAFKSAANKALSGIESGWTDEQKALYLHDYLVATCEYDLTYSKYSAYDVLVGHSAVCQGYALAYDYLLSRAGVGSNVITSDVLNHAWNLVTVKGKTYYVDCTWDDPSNIPLATYCCHDNFLRNKTGFSEVGHGKNKQGVLAEDWINAWGSNVYNSTTIGVSNAYENAFWLDVVSPIPHVGNLWAFVHSTWVSGVNTVSVMAHDYLTGSDITLASGLSGKWDVWDKPGYYHKAYFNCLATDGGVFYVTTSTDVYSVDIAGSSRKIYTLSDQEKAQGFIYGVAYRPADDMLGLSLAENMTGGVTGESSVSLARSIGKAKVTAASCIYSGQGFEPDPVVTIGDKTLVKGVDYQVFSYANNVNAGNGVVTVEGIGNYFGTAVGTFTIKPKAVAPTVALSGTSFVYTGSSIKPGLTVKVDGVVFTSGYSATYSNNVKPGTAKAAVSLTGNYSGTASATFSIKPKATSVSKLKAAKKGFTATWKKQAGCATGYQLQYSLKKSFKGAKTVKIGKAATVSKKISKLKAKKKYFVRVRTVYNGLTSAWSTVKTVKTK